MSGLLFFWYWFVSSVGAQERTFHRGLVCVYVAGKSAFLTPNLLQTRGSFVDVPVEEHCFVVNIGDSLSGMTQGVLRATCMWCLAFFPALQSWLCFGSIVLHSEITQNRPPRHHPAR